MTSEKGTDFSASVEMTNWVQQMTPRFDELKIVLGHDAKMPERAYPTDAGLDLFSAHAGTIPPLGSFVFDTGIHMAIPAGWVGLLTSKSGLMREKEITSAGTIDADYRGSIRAVLFNHSKYPVRIEKWQKITQIVFLPISTPKLKTVTINELDETERGDKGFGSTGSGV